MTVENQFQQLRRSHIQVTAAADDAALLDNYDAITMCLQAGCEVPVEIERMEE